MGFAVAQPILRNIFRFFVPGTFVPGFFLPSFSASDPRPRGWRSAGRRYPLSCRARNRATPRLRSVGRPAQPGRRLAALHRDGFGPAPRSAPELPPASFARATPAAGIASGLPRVPNLLATVLRAAPGRHLPLRLQETLLESAPHERDFGGIARSCEHDSGEKSGARRVAGRRAIIRRRRRRQRLVISVPSAAPIS